MSLGFVSAAKRGLHFDLAKLVFRKLKSATDTIGLKICQLYL